MEQFCSELGLNSNFCSKIRHCPVILFEGICQHVEILKSLISKDVTLDKACTSDVNYFHLATRTGGFD